MTAAIPFWKGVLIGLSIAAPVGPIGVLCIRRTLASGWQTGLASGLGAATADGIYGCVAAFGLTAVSNFLTGQQNWLQLAGGLFLCYLGIKTFLAAPADSAVHKPAKNLPGAYLSTLALTLTNPATIISFAVVFAGLGLGVSGGNYLLASVMVAGVFLGSAAWWLFLSWGVGLLREKFQARQMLWVNRISGAIIFGFGLLALLFVKK